MREAILRVIDSWDKSIPKHAVLWEQENASVTGTGINIIASMCTAWKDNLLSTCKDTGKILKTLGALYNESVGEV
jgi:hypothetical protein